jgi:hypothetical protein
LVLDFGTNVPLPRRRGWRWLAGVAGLALGLAGAQVAQRWSAWRWPASIAEAPQAAAQPAAHLTPPPEVVSVRLDLRSSPAGATVFSSTGQLGPTPLLLMRARGAPTERFTFQKQGYETAIVDLPSDQDTVVQVSLRPLTTPSSSRAMIPDAGAGSEEVGSIATARPVHGVGSAPEAKGSPARAPAHRDSRSSASSREATRHVPVQVRSTRR